MGYTLHPIVNALTPSCVRIANAGQLVDGHCDSGLQCLSYGRVARLSSAACRGADQAMPLLPTGRSGRPARWAIAPRHRKRCCLSRMPPPKLHKGIEALSAGELIFGSISLCCWSRQMSQFTVSWSRRGMGRAGR